MYGGYGGPVNKKRRRGRRWFRLLVSVDFVVDKRRPMAILGIMRKLRAKLSMLLLSFVLFGSASDAAQIRLIHADSGFTSQTENGLVYECFGNVHFTRDSTDLQTDHAVWYEQSGFVRLLGAVRVREPSRILGADSLHYYQKSGAIDAWGRVAVEDSTRHVRVDGGKGIFAQGGESLIMTDNPRLVVDYDLPSVPTVIVADTIAFSSGRNMIDASDSVLITQGSLKAKAKHALIYIDDEEMCLTGDVRASQRENQLSGENMTIYSKEKQLQRIEVNEHGTALFRQLAAADTIVWNESRLTADKINFFFANDLLELIKAQGNSYTYYTPAKEDTLSKGSNVASGDSTILTFANSQLDEVFVVTSAEGAYMTPAATDSLGNVTRVDTVAYSANRINFKLADEVINLRETAKVQQQTMNLTAHEIRYDLKSKDVNAYGHYDSTQSKYDPLTLQDRDENLTGEQLVYNLTDRRGKIKESRTTLEQAYYTSGVLRKEEEGVFLVRKGSYTTCENEEPHFHFASKTMKLQTGDKVFARPVVLYIESLPVMALPFFVFSTKKGRHSGFLPFQLGNFERGQRFVNNLGYYWALSDYWDLRTSIDVSESSGLRFNAAARYAVRYKLSGSVGGSYSRETQFNGVQRSRRTRYQFNFSHNQTLDPTLTIAGSGQFVSDKSYFIDYSSDLAQRLDRQMNSQISISKRWESASLSAAIYQTRYLDTDAHNEMLPTIRFTLSQKPIFRTPKKAIDKRWYHDIYFSYGNSFVNSMSKYMTGDWARRKKYAVFNQQMDLRVPLKIAGVFTLSPSVSAQDNWYYLPYSDVADSNNIETNVLKSRQTWSSSMSISTNLYGTITPHFLSITGLRHILSPSMSFNYQPRFTRNQNYASFTGSGGSGSESKSMSVGIQNQFKMKYLKDGKEVTVTLFNYNLSTGYNFKAVKRKWSQLSSSLYSRTIKNVSLQADFSHDLYEARSENLRWWNPTLKSLSVSTSYSGSFALPVGSAVDTKTTSLAGFTPDAKKVSFSISERYSETRSAYSPTISHWIDFSIQFSPSKNWRVEYQQNYNIRGAETTEKVIRVYRDLHCWEGSFSWIPEGSRAGYYFKINVKALPDLKFEKSESSIRDALLGLIPTR
jgi:lipopolysaccharide assembly outer membrane protein LptD (OstA)